MGQGCEWTNWINQIEGNMDYTLKEGQAIRGVKTEWNDDKGQFNRKDSILMYTHMMKYNLE